MTDSARPSLPQAAFRLRRDGMLVEAYGDPLDFGDASAPFRRGALAAEPVPLEAVLDAESAAAAMAVVRRAIDGQRITFETVELVIGGVAQQYDGWTVPLSDDEAVSIVTNVSARGRFERAVLEAETREQRRIASAVHDGLAQLLTGLALLTNSLVRRGPEHATIDEIKEMEAITREAIARTRALARSLVPGGMDGRELARALEKLADATSTEHGITCTQACEDPGVLDDLAATQLYRIAQEATANAARHAQAGHIHIALERHAHDLELRVSDDGVGLDPERLRQGSGMALMRVRARILGGTLAFDLRPEGGTTVRCVLPNAGAGGDRARSPLPRGRTEE